MADRVGRLRRQACAALATGAALTLGGCSAVGRRPVRGDPVALLEQYTSRAVDRAERVLG